MRRDHLTVGSPIETDLNMEDAVGLDCAGQEGTLVDPIAKDDGLVVATIRHADGPARAGTVVGLESVTARLVHLEFGDLHDAPDADGNVGMIHEEVIDPRVDLELERRQLAEQAVRVGDLLHAAAIVFGHFRQRERDQGGLASGLGRGRTLDDFDAFVHQYAAARCAGRRVGLLPARVRRCGRRSRQDHFGELRIPNHVGKDNQGAVRAGGRVSRLRLPAKHGPQNKRAAPQQRMASALSAVPAWHTITFHFRRQLLVEQARHAGTDATAFRTPPKRSHGRSNGAHQSPCH